MRKKREYRGVTYRSPTDNRCESTSLDLGYHQRRATYEGVQICFSSIEVFAHPLPLHSVLHFPIGKAAVRAWKCQNELDKVEGKELSIMMT